MSPLFVYIPKKIVVDLSHHCQKFGKLLGPYLIRISFIVRFRSIKKK